MLRPFCSAALVVVCLPFVASAQQVPCKPTVVGRLDIVPVTSRIFHNTRNLHVWLPPGYDPSQKHPVLYILDVPAPSTFALRSTTKRCMPMKRSPS